jgi:hypothetical protein
MTEPDLTRLRAILDTCNVQERRALFQMLREEFPIHELEQRLNVSAEVILEAISRASDLTLRGIRGIIAEAAFKQYEIPIITVSGIWKEVPLEGDHAYDFAVTDGHRPVRIQVKMQRQKQQRPMMAYEASQRLFRALTDYYVVETQRTRGGLDRATGIKTRPYRYNEFDILAVSMHPSTGDWSNFLYTVERWLIPTPDSKDEIFKYQPVPKTSNDDWTDSLEQAIEWLRSGLNKQLPIQLISSLSLF